MKNLREEIEKISKTYPIIKTMLFVNGFEDDLLNLFRSWALEMTNALGQSTKGRENKSTEWNDGYVEALFDVEKKIEEASK